MELRSGESAVEKLKARFEVLARGDGEVCTRTQQYSDDNGWTCMSGGRIVPEIF
jgi:hypothetical protein